MGMRLLIDTSKTMFTVSKVAAPKTDEHDRQRMDKRTKLPLYAAELVAQFEEGADVISVTLATANPPKLTRGASVSVPGLEAVPWVRGTSAQISYRAENIVPANGKAA